MKQFIKCLIIASVVAIGVTGLQQPVHRSTIVSKDAPKGEISAAHTVVPDPPKPAVVAKPTISTPSPIQTAGSGSCAAEIAKYDWPQAVAYNVMMAESKGDPGTVNDNPRTGDYSIGCFQINLYGANARTRPSEAWLKVAANNVSYAYGMWKGQGWTPWGFTTCKYKVTCY
jgi:hypothetical protein